MNVLIETCLNDLYILLFEDNKVHDRILIKNLREKSDYLPGQFAKLLARNKLEASQINKFFVTSGPGSFMGIRAGLLFAQTLAGVLQKKLFTCSTLAFLQTMQSKQVFVDARGGFFYTLVNKQVQLQKGAFQPTNTNYDFFEKNLATGLKSFKLANSFQDNTLYIKKPRIG